MTEQEKSRFLKEYTQAILEENAAIFAGAGLSSPAGFVNWKDLLRDIANDLGLEIDYEHDLIAIAQYHFNHYRRAKLNTLIAQEFIRGTQRTENHKILARMPIRTYWTTNYDTLIETTLEEERKTPDTKIHKEDFSRPLPKRDAVVYKMHGDVSDASQAVITRDDYEKYNEERLIFSTALQGDLATKTFLFMGFSFDDPNLTYILSRIRILLGQNQVNHFCFFKRINREEFEETEEGEKKYHREEIHQQLKIKDLERFNIKSLLIDDYSEITELLKQIEKRIKRRSIFISGAAHEYGKWTAEQANSLVYNLSNKLAERFKLVTGFGLGIGSSVINGALKHLYSTKYQHLDDVLVLRPFPQIPPPDSDLADLWDQYRREMISNAGISIFLFGNKLDKDAVILSDGLKKEFEIARELGLIVIPVGATGYMSKVLWEEVMASYDKFYPSNNELKKAITRLGDDTIKDEEIVNNVVKAVGILHQS